MFIFWIASSCIALKDRHDLWIVYRLLRIKLTCTCYVCTVSNADEDLWQRHHYCQYWTKQKSFLTSYWGSDRRQKRHKAAEQYAKEWQRRENDAGCALYLSFSFPLSPSLSLSLCHANSQTHIQIDIFAQMLLQEVCFKFWMFLDRILCFVFHFWSTFALITCFAHPPFSQSLSLSLCLSLLASV